MSWLLGDDDPAQGTHTHEDDEIRRQVWNETLQLLAVLAIVAYVAFTLGKTIDQEHDATMQRQAPLIERWRALVGPAAK